MNGWGLLTVVLFGLNGCILPTNIQYYTVTPIDYEDQPFLDIVYRPPMVESFTPMLRWKPRDDDVKARFDIIFFEALPWRGDWVIGREVYYREGLRAPEHTLEEKLKPNQVYFWSVRLRRGEKDVSPWAHFVSGSCDMMTRCYFIDYPFFLLRTPAK